MKAKSGGAAILLHSLTFNVSAPASSQPSADVVLWYESLRGPVHKMTCVCGERRPLLMRVWFHKFAGCSRPVVRRINTSCRIGPESGADARKCSVTRVIILLSWLVHPAPAGSVPSCLIDTAATGDNTGTISPQPRCRKNFISACRCCPRCTCISPVVVESTCFC